MKYGYPYRQASVYIDVDYMRKRVCCYSTEYLVTKAFKVKNWMDMNPENDWVQDTGNNIIGKLNAMPTLEEGTIR